MVLKQSSDMAGFLDDGIVPRTSTPADRSLRSPTVSWLAAGVES